MKLERLHLKNFRCFDSITLEFGKRLTVIIAENGAGKTAMLDAIAIGFGPYLRKLPGNKSRSTKETDLRVSSDERREPFMMLAWEARTYDGRPVVWSGGRRRDSAVTSATIRKHLSESQLPMLNLGRKEIDEYALSLVNAESEQQAYFLPVIAYYGTNRAIREEVQRRRGFKKKFSRFDALSGALEPDSRFRSAFEWFNAMEDAERREREALRDFDYRHPELQVVRSAIERLLQGYKNPRTEIRPLRFVIDKIMPDGKVCTLRVSQLSDGYRVILGLTMDLARRMAQANSQGVPDDMAVKNPLDMPAIALIDEVDLHLHPSWQQRIVTDLMQTFTNTQFILTTHSAPVLTTVPSECIRILRDNKVYSAPPGTEGAEAGRMLRQVLGLKDVRPPANQATRELREYLALVDRDEWSSLRAQELRRKLDERYQGQEPALLEADLQIENRKWELRE